MYVLATAGHVDHGKSTLVRALTGMEPDRWEEERRRGLTIGLGFAWTTLPTGERVAFVDVPGHERFVPTMLAGVGPVPAVLLVVAADEGWMPQSQEHLAALHALGVRHGLLVITRCDLADPAAARVQARAHLAGTSLEGMPSVAVSASTGAGLDALRAGIAALIGRLPAADPVADVRLWIDRSFAVTGAGTVATGTLTAGTVSVGDLLVIASTGRTARVRGLHMLGEGTDRAVAVARVAVNLHGVERAQVAHGDALLTPGAWLTTDLIDVTLPDTEADLPAPDLPAQLMLHLGSAAVPVRVRALGKGTARLRLDRALPLRIGDRPLLRDPGGHRIVTAADVADIRPPELNRRGAAARRDTELVALLGATPSARTEAYLRAHGTVQASDLRAMGLPIPAEPPVDGWYLDPGWLAGQARRLAAELATWQQTQPVSAGLPVAIARQRLGLSSAALLDAVVAEAGLVRSAGSIAPARAVGWLPDQVRTAIEAIRVDLAAAPFAAPPPGRLAELGLGTRELAAATRAGALLAVAEGVVLLPGADRVAAATLARLPQPFTASQARIALNTSRRVVVPLLESLARAGLTRRLPDGTHMMVAELQADP